MSVDQPARISACLQGVVFDVDIDVAPYVRGLPLVRGRAARAAAWPA
jgi:hypothetical protein